MKSKRYRLLEDGVISYCRCLIIVQRVRKQVITPEKYLQCLRLSPPKSPENSRFASKSLVSGNLSNLPVVFKDACCGFSAAEMAVSTTSVVGNNYPASH